MTLSAVDRIRYHPPMPRLERSAGFILFREDASFAGGRAYLLLDYGRHWDYAKGHVEPGEDDLTAAHRELHEETGIDDAGVRPGFAHEIEYYFRKPKHGIVRKTVIFFLASTRATDVKISHEHVGFEFLSYEDALKRLTYATAREVLRAAEAFMSESRLA
ncbi:MAG: NUDIX domain-containing protein [Tepidisphaeraceae bacterium]